MKFLRTEMAFPLFILLLSAWGCTDDFIDSKEEEKEALRMPPATQSGNNTLGCKIDGKVWRPEIGINWHPNHNPEKLLVHYEPEESYFYLGANREYKNYLNAEIRIQIRDSITENKRYKLSAISDTSNWALIERYCDLYTELINQGFILFTRIDTSQNIVSGKFEFTGVNDTCNEKQKLPVTEGRFDIAYQDY